MSTLLGENKDFIVQLLKNPVFELSMITRKYLCHHWIVPPFVGALLEL